MPSKEAKGSPSEAWSSRVAKRIERRSLGAWAVLWTQSRGDSVAEMEEGGEGDSKNENPNSYVGYHKWRHDLLMKKTMEEVDFEASERRHGHLEGFQHDEEPFTQRRLCTEVCPGSRETSGRRQKFRGVSIWVSLTPGIGMRLAGRWRRNEGTGWPLKGSGSS